MSSLDESGGIQKRRMLPGHALLYEAKTRDGGGNWTSNDVGEGACRCGALSPALPNSSRRRQWHADHKADIVAGGSGRVWDVVNDQPDELVEYIRALWPQRPLSDPMGRGKKPLTTAERFFQFVDADGPCWEWTGAINSNGYGQFGRGRGLGGTMAHRAAWELLVGEIPAGKTMDHLCRNRQCVNPDHLEPVDHEENLRRGFGLGVLNSRKTKCPQGHEYDKVINRPGGKVARICSRCLNARYTPKPGVQAGPSDASPSARDEEICRRYAAGGVTLADLGRTYGLGRARIHEIVRTGRGPDFHARQLQVTMQALRQALPVLNLTADQESIVVDSLSRIETMLSVGSLLKDVQPEIDRILAVVGADSDNPLGSLLALSTRRLMQKVA